MQKDNFDGKPVYSEEMIDGIITRLNNLPLTNMNIFAIDDFIKEQEAALPGQMTGEEKQYFTGYIQNLLVEVQQKLFVYGTLQPGERNFHIIEGIGGNWQAGHIIGSLLNHGWGAATGFPAFSFDGSQKIPGHLLTSANLPPLLANA